MSEPVMFESLSSRVSKFNEKVNRHLINQSLNPFSGNFQNTSRMPPFRPSFSKDEYGKILLFEHIWNIWTKILQHNTCLFDRPAPGSKTELRGRKAHSHICREILELCEIIYDMNQYQKNRRKNFDKDVKYIEEESSVSVKFGDLFQMYTKISNKVVGLLIAAKKRGLVHFEGEVLFQGRDDEVLITVKQPISEIREVLKQEAPDTIHSVQC